MTGLPRGKDTTRPQDAWMVMVCGGIEKLTHSLRRGDPFSAKALEDMQAMDRRLNAFRDALASRMEVIEQD